MYTMRDGMGSCYTANAIDTQMLCVSNLARSHRLTMGVIGSTMRRQKKSCGHKSDKDAVMDLSQMWNMINNLPPVERLHDHSSQRGPSGWITIRVFVSSTFDDFHSEREVLVKQVFPELREWCEARSMCLVECDLRWGIPKDTSSGKIFSTCLGELDRCHQDSFGMPFMVVLLGERAGWIPHAAEVPQEIVDVYRWINGMSVTGTEILHGAYRNYNPNAAFCLRDPSFLLQLPQEDLPRYQDKGHKAVFMKSLKEQVSHRFPEDQILHYGCQILSPDSATRSGKVKLGFSSDFSLRIVEFLKKRILETFPERSAGISARAHISWEETELAQHHLFLHQKQQLFLGRDLELQRILEFLHMDQVDSTMLENKDSAEWRIPVYQIVSEPGRGKSSLLAACISRVLQLPRSRVFYHFVGCSPSSVQLSNIVMRLCCNLMSSGPEQEDILEKLRNCWRNEEMKDILQHVLQTSAKLTNMATYIFIDAINQLPFPADVNDLFSWLSTQGFLPPSYKFVISCTPDSALHSMPSSNCLELDLLSPGAAQNLAVLYLSRYCKILSTEQLYKLLQKSSSTHPLWISLACEELRVYGVFEMLTKKIIGLPGTLQGLLESIIQRLVQEDDSNRVKKLLCLLHCCQEGVAEQDLQGAMSTLEGASEIPAMHWATLRRTLSCLLRVGQDHRGKDMLGFFHGSVAEAVEKCLLSPDNSHHLYLVNLADYYEYKCTDNATVINQLPQLLQKAMMNSRLVNFLRKDPRARSIQAHTRTRYLKGLRCTNICRDGFLRSQAMICGMCSMKIGAFGQLFGNKQSCVLCGAHVTIMGREAFLCSQHYRVGTTECLVCKSPILGHPPPSPALLCHSCGFYETCVALKK
ncbi:telomerase protein component 1-like [Hyla sarda]|uniref:telomerase protein component 1-like n=1 Tax=Hyla sarda TaxID=327740 RepID=UPI0024C3B463|nr:telomerase protein component 1-like [Hyla sarda]